ncbi:hypothetical protein DL764_005898 [Monosporascus ibericus]|uniref:Uncharacterized protein n=1 Tax=Monosporascus ibericus TaxID=155417 RepID=A0A4Q4T7A7_9PEZI|nr:hypothetical protein DL764_005898 [Monosporascus ibericus]
MADPLTVVGIVANIIQLVDFGSRVLNRLEEYQSKFGDAPEAFRNIKAELPVLLDALRQTKAAIDAGFLQDESKNALLPAVEGCGVQINLLDDVIAEVLPAPGESWAKKGRKALRSLRYDMKVEKITSVVRGYIQTLIYHAAASLRLFTDCKNKQPASRVAFVGLGGVGIPPMEKAYVLALLRNKLGGSVEHDDSVALVEALNYMPLAIAQAAAYISQRTPRATVSRYLQDLRRGGQDRAKLLNMDIGDFRKDGTASNSIIAAWQIFFEHIRKDRPSAMRLLSLMSLFDRQGIPDFLLDDRYQDDSDASFDFEEDLNTLTSFSLVTTDVKGHLFEMYRLVQFSTRK